MKKLNDKMHLNEMYKIQKFAQLERSRKIHSDNVLTESAYLLLEKLDPAKLKFAIESITKLRKVVSKYNLPTLKTAIENAAKDAADALGGGGIMSFFKRLSGKGSFGKDHERIAKLLTFQKSIIDGLQQLPQILELITDDLQQTDPVIDQLDNDQQSGAKKAIMNALAMPSKFFKSQKIPYLGVIGSASQKVVDEILQLSGNDFKSLATQSAALKDITQEDDLQNLASQAQTAGKLSQQGDNAPKIDIIKKDLAAANFKPDDINKIIDIVNDKLD